MTELNERIREFIDSGAAPVSAEEIFLAHRTASAKTTAERVRPRLSRRLLVLSGVAIAIALVSIGLVSVPGAKNVGAPPASAATFLESVALKAAAEKSLVPGPGQYLYVAKITSMVNGSSVPPTFKAFWFDADDLGQVWTSPRAVGHQTWQIVGRPAFLSAADRAIWVADGSKPFGSGGAGGGLPTYYDVAALPTKVSSMLAYFKSQRNLPTESSYGAWPSWEFDIALGFLQNGASSTQRAALLKFIATIPGVRLMGHATSVVTGEKGSVIALPRVRSGWTEEAIFNPSSSKLIETRLVLTSLSTTPTQIGTPPPFVGEIESYTDLLFAGVTRVNSKFSLPAGTPTFPGAWPFGSVREPLPGWVGSASR